MSKHGNGSGKGWTRRQFLTRVGQAGGAAALYETMVAMGMINKPSAWAGPPKLSRGHGEGKSVLILGAGIGGLTAAYLLNQYGYRCEILEASSRAGGRNHTARRGSTVIESSPEHGRTVQTCQFDDDLYLNLGPGRLPYHHRRVLAYCRELNVALEPYIMNTTGNLFQSEQWPEGKATVYRQVQNDTRGYIAEMLAKCIHQGALDQELNQGDRDNLLSLLQTFGPLGSRHKSCEDNQDYNYEGSTRTGCADAPNNNPTPNVFYNCKIPNKTPLKTLLQSQFWKDSFYDPFEFEWQPTLFQPVGGMDMIVEGFKRAVGHLITYNAPVTKIENLREGGIAVSYRDGNATKTKTADFCVSNIPCPILKDIPNNFSQGYREVIQRTTFDASCKVGWQCNSRFWENDHYQIYGGISWTEDMIEQIWYPSSGFFGQKGTLTGAYIHDGTCPDDPKHATEFGKLSLDKRLAVAKQGGARLHREFENNSIVPTELGMSIAWQNVEHQKGAWASWGNNQHDDRDYRRLLLPEGKFFVVGDQASTLPGWQEGAMMSAEHVVELIGGIKEAVVPEDVTAPNTIKVTQGHG